MAKTTPTDWTTYFSTATFVTGTSQTGAVMTGAATISTIDGYNVQLGDSILIHSENTPSSNRYGSWTFEQLTNPFRVRRSANFDGVPFEGEVNRGDYVVITTGATYQYTGWAVSTSGAIDVDETPISFVMVAAGLQLGPQGPTGSTGATGSIGPTGPQASLISETGAIGILTGANLYYTGSSIINTLTTTTGSITNLTTSTGSITNLSSALGVINTLTTTTGTIGALTSTTGTIGALTSTTGAIDALTSTTGTIGALTSTTGAIDALTSTTGTIGALTSTTGSITNLILPSLSTSLTGGIALYNTANSRLAYVTSAGSATQYFTSNGDGTYTWTTGVSGLNTLSDAATSGTNVILGIKRTFVGAATNNILINPSRATNIVDMTSNVAIGNFAGQLMTGTNCSENVGVGNNALRNTTGSNNSAHGSSALFSNRGGFANTAMGYAASQNNVSANFTTAVGDRALFSNLVDDLTAVGALSLFNNTTGARNTAVGTRSLMDNVVSSRNTAFGHFALTNITGGDNNTGLGYAAGTGATLTSGAIFLGANSGQGINSQNNGFYLSTGLSTGTTGGIQFYNSTSGQVGYVSSVGTNGQVFTANGTGGYLWTTVSGGGATSLGGLSDALSQPATGALALGYIPTAITTGAIIIRSQTGANGNYTGANGMIIGNNPMLDRYDMQNILILGTNITGSFTGAVLPGIGSTGGIAIGHNSQYIGHSDILLGNNITGPRATTSYSNILLGNDIRINQTGTCFMSSNTYIGSRSIFSSISGFSCTDNTFLGAGITGNAGVANVVVGSNCAINNGSMDISTGSTLIGSQITVTGTTNAHNLTIIGSGISVVNPQSNSIYNRANAHSGTTGSIRIYNPTSGQVGYVTSVGTNGQVFTANGTGGYSWNTLNVNSLADATINTGSATISIGNKYASYTPPNSVIISPNTINFAGAGGGSCVHIGSRFVGGIAAGNTGTSNVTIGASAFAAYTGSTSQCVAIGAGSMINIVTGGQNVAVGYLTMETNLGGTDNVAVGYICGRQMNGSRNTYIGSQTAINPHTNNDVIAIGYQAATQTPLQNNGFYLSTNLSTGTTGGIQFYNPTSGQIGYVSSVGTNGQVFTANGTGGYSWTAAGASAINGLTDGFSQSSTGAMVIGFKPSLGATGTIIIRNQTGASYTGANCLFIGNNYIASNSDRYAFPNVIAIGNNITGDFAIDSSNATSGGIAIGNNSVLAGYNHISIGHNITGPVGGVSADAIFIGNDITRFGTANYSQSIHIGSKIKVPGANANQQKNIVIGSGITGTSNMFGQDCIIIGTNMFHTSGNGPSNNIYMGNNLTIDSTGNSNGSGIVVLAPNSTIIPNVNNSVWFRKGLASVSSTQVTYDTTTGQMGPSTSSQRFKQNITDLEDEKSENIYNLRPRTYEYITASGATRIGLIAEEVVDYFPECVPLDNVGPYSVNYDTLVVPIIAEMKKLRTRIATLETQNASYATRLATIESRLGLFEA
jgi:hypothetical protein